MNVFREKRVLVTGGGSGIGKAIAVKLKEMGADVYVASRSCDADIKSSGISFYPTDLSNDADIERLVDTVKDINILVHCAGHFSTDSFTSLDIDTFDQCFHVNVRAPLLLTKSLLDGLIESRGQVVFINSSVWLNAKADLGAYSISKYALKAFADVLRQEVNPHGVRVLSVYPGRTASKMQEKIHLENSQPYFPDRLMQPEDVAQTVLDTLTLPVTAEVTDIQIRPMLK